MIGKICFSRVPHSSTTHTRTLGTYICTYIGSHSRYWNGGGGARKE